MRAITNVTIFDFHDFIADGYVKFDRRIAETGSMEQFDGSGCEAVTSAKGSVLMPGFVNAHHHSYAVFGRGWHAKSSAADLLTMLQETWWKLDGMLGSEEIREAGMYNAGEMIKNGITTVIEHHAGGKQIDGSLSILKESMCDNMGMRAIFCFETSDRYPVDACIRENLRFSGENQSVRTAGIFGMNACLSLSEETLKKIAGELGSMPIHIHVGESETDYKISMERYGKSPVRRLKEHGLLNKNSILSHCIFVTEEDWELLKEHDIYVAMNVTSNLNNDLGVPDYLYIREQGKKCLLGCDGHGMNFAKELTNFYYGMRQKYHGLKEITFAAAEDILKQNQEYASKLLGCRLGRIKAGYEADFVLCDYESPTPMTAENVRDHYWSGILESFHPRDVWCMGEQLLKDYNLVRKTGINIDRLQTLAAEVWNQF